MSTIEDEPRVDGRDLQPPAEPGSDELMSDEVKAKIREVIEHWEDRDDRRREDDVDEDDDERWHLGDRLRKWRDGS